MATTFPSSPMMRAFAAGVRGNVPTVVWGDPGVGKTAKIGAYASAWGFHTETVVGSIREASRTSWACRSRWTARCVTAHRRSPAAPPVRTAR